MQTVIAAVVFAAVLTLSGQAWAQAQVTCEHQNMKEATVFAHFEYANNLGGSTFVDVIASQPAPGSTSPQILSFPMLQTDANGFDGFGFIDISPSILTLTEATDLSTARLQATGGYALNLFNDNVFPFSVDLTFSATGDEVDGRTRFHFAEPGTVTDSHIDGQNREATAAGTLQVGSTNYTPVASQISQIQFNRTGAFFQQIVLPPEAHGP